MAVPRCRMAHGVDHCVHQGRVGRPLPSSPQVHIILLYSRIMLCTPTYANNTPARYGCHSCPACPALFIHAGDNSTRQDCYAVEHLRFGCPYQSKHLWLTFVADLQTVGLHIR
eukprot:190945-Chlamydomonas_euryale.AAC.8